MKAFLQAGAVMVLLSIAALAVLARYLTSFD